MAVQYGQYLMLKLRDELVNKIITFPEGGMGYNRVNFTLKDGRFFKDVTTCLIDGTAWGLSGINASLYGVSGFDDADIADVSSFI